MTLLALLLAVATVPQATTAQASPTPVPTAAPVPKNFDPCAGPLELLNKIGNGTACVFVRGEAAITAQYESVNIPANSQVNISTPLGGRSVVLSTYAHGFGYPASLIYVGVGPREQIAITPPSFAQVNSSAAEALTGNSVLAAGATNMKFEYKQLLYVNLTRFTMFAVALDYNAPTGSPALRGRGPSYTVNPRSRCRTTSV